MPVEVGRGRKGGDPHAGGKRGRDGEEVLVMPIYLGGGYKTRNGTERNGTELGVIDAQCREPRKAYELLR